MATKTRKTAVKAKAKTVRLQRKESPKRVIVAHSVKAGLEHAAATPATTAPEPAPAPHYVAVLTTDLTDLAASSISYLKLDGPAFENAAFPEWLCGKLGCTQVKPGSIIHGMGVVAYLLHRDARHYQVTARPINGEVPQRIELEIGMSFRDGDDVWTIASKPVGNYVWVQCGEHGQMKHVRAVEQRLFNSPVRTKTRIVTTAGGSQAVIVSKEKQQPAHVRRGGDVGDEATLAVKACATLDDAWQLAKARGVKGWAEMKANYEAKGTNPGMQRMWITARIRALNNAKA